MTYLQSNWRSINKTVRYKTSVSFAASCFVALFLTVILLVRFCKSRLAAFHRAVTNRNTASYDSLHLQTSPNELVS